MEYPASTPRADAIEIQTHEFDNVIDDDGLYKNSSIDKENLVLLMKGITFNESLGAYLVINTFCGAGLHVTSAFNLNEYVDLINIMSLNLYYLYLIQYNLMCTAPNKVLYAPKFVPTISQLTGIVSITWICCIKFMIVHIDALV